MLLILVFKDLSLLAVRRSISRRSPLCYVFLRGNQRIRAGVFSERSQHFSRRAIYILADVGDASGGNALVVVVASVSSRLPRELCYLRAKCHG